LGWTLRLLGDLEGARAEHAESAAMMSRQFGLDDPRVAMALTNLGLAELEAGDIGGARAHQQRAYEALLCAYGPDHCNTRLVVGRLENLVSGEGSRLPEAANGFPRRTPGSRAGPQPAEYCNDRGRTHTAEPRTPAAGGRAPRRYRQPRVRPDRGSSRP